MSRYLCANISQQQLDIKYNWQVNDDVQKQQKTEESFFIYFM